MNSPTQFVTHLGLETTERSTVAKLDAHVPRADFGMCFIIIIIIIINSSNNNNNEEDDDDYDDDDDDDLQYDYDGHSEMNVLARHTALKR